MRFTKVYTFVLPSVSWSVKLAGFLVCSSGSSLQLLAELFADTISAQTVIMLLYKYFSRIHDYSHTGSTSELDNSCNSMQLPLLH